MTATSSPQITDQPGGVPPQEADPPERIVLGLTIVGVLAVLIGQLVIVPGLVHPATATAFFDASPSNPTLLLNAVAAVVIVIASFALPARWRLVGALPGAGLLALTFGGAITLGHHALDFGAAVLTMTSMYALGRLATSRLSNPALRGVLVIDLVIGASILGVAVQCLGRLHLLYWWSVGLAIVAFGLLGLRWAVAGLLAHRSSIVDTISHSPIAAAATGLVLLQLGWSVIYLSAPDIMFDALYGKAYLPELWAHTHSIGPLYQFPALNLSGLTQIIATPGHTLGSGDVGRWLQDASWITVVATAWWWGGRRSVVGPVAAVAIAVTPQLLWQNSTGYDDNVLMLPLAALTIGAIRLLRSDAAPEVRDSWGTALALGALGGAAIWFKLHLLVMAFVVLAGWTIVSGPLRRIVVRGVWVGIGTVAVAGPAMLFRWIDTGNPVFPNYNNIFRSQYAPPINDKLNFPFWPDAGSLGWLKLPYEAVAHTSLMSEAAPPGGYGLLVAIVVVALIVGWRAGIRTVERRGALLIWIALALTLYFWWGQLRYLRYAIPTSIAATMLLLVQLRGWRPGRRSTWAVGVFLAVSGVVFMPGMVASFWNVPGHKVPYGAAFGTWNKEQYLRTVFPQKDAIEAYQAAAPKGAVAASDVPQRLLLQDRYLASMLETGTRLTLIPPAPANGDQAYEKLRQLGITWAMIDDTGTSLSTYPWLFMAIQSHGQIVFSDRGFSVWRLAPTPTVPTQDQTCDSRFLGSANCWSGNVDKTPGLVTPEIAGRTIQSCPGAIVAVGITTASGGAPSGVIVDPQGNTGLRGYNPASVPPGKTTWVYTTVPAGSATVSITVLPGAGSKVERVVTGHVGAACANPGVVPAAG